MKYTKIPEDTFKNLQLNAGIIVDSFDPVSQTIGNIIGATTGGIQFTATPTFEDFGDDIDNCPKNTKELKKLTAWAIALSGNYVTVTAAGAASLIGAADVNGIKVVPRSDVLSRDFKDVWWIGDYSNVNSESNAGFCAIHMMNALNTGGFQVTSSDKGKGQFAFNYEAHYSMDAQDVVPFEVYVHGGEDAVGGISFNTHSVTLEVGDNITIDADVLPVGTEVTWSSSDTEIATVSGGTVTAVSEGNTIVRGVITVDGVGYDDSCTIIVIESEG